MIALVVNSFAAIFALAAGVLWYRSGRVNTPESFSVAVDISQSTWDGSVGGTGYSADLLELAKALKLQSRLSRYAAFCASVAAVLQAAALAIAAANSN